MKLRFCVYAGGYNVLGITQMHNKSICIRPCPQAFKSGCAGPCGTLSDGWCDGWQRGLPLPHSGFVTFHLSCQVVADGLQVDQPTASLRTGFSQANGLDLAAIDQLVGEAAFQPEQALNVSEPSELRKCRATIAGRNRRYGGFRAHGARWCSLVIRHVC